MAETHLSPGPHVISRSRLCGVIALVFVLIMGLGLLSWMVVRQIEALGSASTDNVQWSLSQMDVELLTLQLAAADAIEDPSRLDQMRLRFDIAYSRFRTLQAGGVFQSLRESRGFDAAFAALERFMLRSVGVIDGPDPALLAALPGMKQELRKLIPEARRLGTIGVEVFARSADQARTEIKLTLVALAILSLALLTALVAVMVHLVNLNRLSRQRAVELAQTASRLDAVIGASLDSVVTLDETGRITGFSPAAEQTFGHSRAAMLGRELTALVPPDAQGAPQIDLASLPVQGFRRLRVTARDAKGRDFPAEVSVSAIQAGERRLAVAFLSDLSQEVAAEQALMQARDDALAGEKAKSDLLVVMSHEIRTPLNGMIGTIDLLQETDLSAQQRDYLRIMATSGRILMGHVNDILHIARLDSGKAPLTLAPVDLTELVGEVVENQGPAAQAQGNRLELDIARGCPVRVLADGPRLRQILLNLVGNAVKFTRKGRISIRISHQAPQGPFLVEVEDTGIGIAPENLGRIFDDFVTLDPSFGRNAAGTGLGLGIVRRIVQQMGGTITVDSTQGRGSTFRLTLPLALADRMPVQTEAPVPTLASLKLLVVEDNEVNRMIVRDMLTREGHRVTEARDGEEGLRKAGREVFDLILMDISMPGLDGVAATEAIRAGQGPNRTTPILALTAHVMPQDAERFLAAGMQAVLMKPVQRKRLRQALAEHGGAPAQDAGPGLPSEVSLMDGTALSQMAEGLDPEVLADLTRRFLSDTTERLSRLSPATEAEVLLREVHHMAGSAGVFGAGALKSALDQMMSDLRSDRTDAARAALPDLAALWERTAEAYRRSLGPLTSSGTPSRAQASSLR